MDQPIHNPPLPFVGPIHSGLTSGSLIRIQGTTLPSATCFSVNLQCGPSINYGNDIALHLSPVFNPPPRVVRNSFENQHWGAEESHGPGFPFVPGQGFEILILTDTSHFKIAINGQHYTEFNHRISVHRVSHIAVTGDVTISVISFEGNPARAPSPSPCGGGGFAGGFMVPSAPPTSGGPPLPPYPSQPSAVPAYPAQPPPSYPGYVGPQLQPPYSGYPPPQYPSQPAGAYPAGAYPAGTTTVQYPHSPTSQQKSGFLPAGLSAGLAAGAASLGAAVLNKGMHKHGKHKKHSSFLPGGLATGTGLAAGTAALAAGAGLMGHGPHQQHSRSHAAHSKRGSMLPTGLAVGAAALTGAALMGRGPLGKVMKPKKMKKLYKHKGWGSSSSSSSSSEEEE